MTSPGSNHNSNESSKAQGHRSAILDTKDKPYVCHCGTAFARRDLLTRHERLSHGHTSPYQKAQTSANHQRSTGDPVVESLAGTQIASGVSASDWTAPSSYKGTQRQRLQQGRNSQEGANDILETAFAFFNEDGNYFQEFATFLDGIGLPAEWTPPDIRRELDTGEAGTEEHDKRESNYPPSMNGESGPSSPFGSWPPSVPQGHQSLSSISDKGPHDTNFKTISLQVSSDIRARFNSALERYHNVVPNFILPSKHTLTRYLILAICATGAQYCFKHQNSKALFYAAKSIVLAKSPQAQQLPGLSSYALLSADTEHPNSRIYEPMDSIRYLLILMGYATWEDVELLREASSLQNLLVHCLREAGLREVLDLDLSSTHTSWIGWSAQESARRTKLVSFAFIHVHSVAYNVYPALRSNEIHLRLPCSTKEWNAQTAIQWQAARRDVKAEQLHYQDALSHLLTSSKNSTLIDPTPAPLGNYILLHGLLQRVHMIQKLSLSTVDYSASLPDEELNKIEYTQAWKQAPESSLDPSNENGPIPFTSSALLGLAYICACLDLGPHRALETRNPSLIAVGIAKASSPLRGRFLIPALIYSAHALSIPVRLGIDSVAQCAIFLSKWLCSLCQPHNAHALTDMVSAIVQEALSYLDFDETDTSINFDLLRPYALGLAVPRLWARLFKRNVQWPFINIIGQALEKYAEMMPVG
ncbi:fungal-specific transcription factor domain-containing protein [Trichoderma chlorosporum]